MASLNQGIQQIHLQEIPRKMAASSGTTSRCGGGEGGRGGIKSSIENVAIVALKITLALNPDDNGHIDPVLTHVCNTW